MDSCPAPADFQAIHDEYRPRVLRYLARLAGHAEAEDLAQEVMLKVSQGLPAFRGEASLSTWIYRIATHAAMDRFRRRHVEPAIEADADAEKAEEALALEAPTLEDGAIRQEMGACVRDFVERLPAAYRAVLVLAALEGFANEEIAAILGLPVGTVKIRLHRARGKLRESLAAGCAFERDRAGGLVCDRKAADRP